MSIDYNKNTYAKIGNFTNVVNEIPHDQITTENKDAPSHFHGFLDPLVDKLALKHPEWMLVGEDSWYNYSRQQFLVKRIRVYEDGEQLGTIAHNDWKGSKYRIQNKRINNSMRKRSAMETKDLKKALGIIEEHFGAKSLDERVTEARNLVASTVANTLWRKRRSFDECFGKLAPALAAYITQNMEQMRPILEAYGAPAGAIDRLPDEFATLKNNQAVEQARSRNVGTTVILYRDRYVLIHDDNTHLPLTLTASQLTPDMSAKIGMLKIISGDEEAVESVGMRINSNTFYLLP